MNIFDIITAENITVYYNERGADRGPFLGDTLWQPTKQLDINIKNIKGAKGRPVVLKASAYDVQAVPRLRPQFNAQTMEIPYFKESMYIDEVTRKKLNQVLATGNAQYIALVMNEVYNDPMTLIDGAAARREQMRMMLLTTGIISVESNGQAYDFDFGVPDSHKITATTAWSNPNADIIGDINRGLEVLNADNSLTPERGVVNRKTWLQMKSNAAIAKILYPTGSQTSLTDAAVQQVISEYCGIQIAVYDMSYIGDDGLTHKYIPDGTASFFPAGYLGQQVFSTTPQEDDLMSGSAANVSIVDLGVSVTTVKHTDPVNVETIVAQTTLPSFPVADSLLIIDTEG